MDILIIGLITVGIFGLALLATKCYSIFVAWKKAYKTGLSLGLFESISLTKFYELDQHFLQACLEFKQFDPSISIKDIVRHHMADGNTWELLNLLKKLKKENLEMPIESAILYDLSNKDLLEIARKQHQVFAFELTGDSKNGLRYLYSCSFKISPDSLAWIDPDIEQYRWEIGQEIEKGMDSENESVYDDLVLAILEKHLNSTFWKKLCHGIELTQDLKIMTK